MTQKFTTTLNWTDPETDADMSVGVEVEYTYYPGYAATLVDPPETASVEIQSATPDVPAELYDQLAEQAFMHHQDYLADAAEYRYDSRRDYD